MSYPGYNPYQQGPPQAMPGMPPYPQQQSQNSGGAPYPTATAPYPPKSFNEPVPLPTQFNTNFGNFSTPTYMPMPTSMGQPPMGQYPPQPSAQYPPQPTGPYPPQPSGQYPPQSSGQYPPQPSGQYPPQPTGQYPPQPTGQYPPQSSGQYPPQSSGQYPPQSSPYPSQSSMGGYPPMGNPSMPSHSSMPPSSSNPLYPSLGSQSSGPSYPNPVAQKTNYGALGSAHPVHAHSSQQSYKKKYSPTVLPAEPFEPRADAETLRKAMKGFGTDEKAIIQVLANRTNAQRLEIGVQFKTLYGKDLVKDLKSETSGRFEDLLVAMMMPLPQYYAKEIHEALSGVGTDEDTLIEVLCTMNNHELRTIRAAYESMYHSSLENDLSGDTSGTFRRLMVSLCTANRDESMTVNPDAVQRDAQALLRAGELRLGTDESTFNAVLCQRNYAHLNCVFQEYERITGHDIEKAIKNEFSGDAEEGLLAVVRSIKDKAQFFARRLHQSMKGMGTNDKQLIRLVVTRSEVDMGEIKNAYQAKYGESLADAISSDCSGDYKKCLLALINI